MNKESPSYYRGWSDACQKILALFKGLDKLSGV